jgi:hypothetical protein
MLQTTDFCHSSKTALQNVANNRFLSLVKNNSADCCEQQFLSHIKNNSADCCEQQIYVSHQKQQNTYNYLRGGGGGGGEF